MTQIPPPEPPATRSKVEVDLLRYWATAFFTGLIAAFAGITLVRLAGDVFDTPLFVTETGGSELVPLTDGRVLVATLVVTFVAAATFNVMLYLVPNARTFFVTLALVVLAASLLWPASLDLSSDETIWLIGLHLIVGIIIIGLMSAMAPVVTRTVRVPA